MRRRDTNQTSSQRRLLRLFEQVEDPDLKEIMSNVVMLESRYRSSSAERFPLRQVRDIIDAVAKRQENQES